MGVTLSIEISSPLEPEDRELLTGLSIMTLAIANHEMAKEHFPGTFPDPDEMVGPAEEELAGVARSNAPVEAAEPAACGAHDDEGLVCISELGHRGRHRFRARIPYGPAPGLN